MINDNDKDDEEDKNNNDLVTAPKPFTVGDEIEVDNGNIKDK